MRIAPYPDVRVKDSDAERRRGGAGPGTPPSPERTDGPLTDDQLAFYRQRIESGFYRSDTVRRHIAERLVDDVLPHRKD